MGRNLACVIHVLIVAVCADVCAGEQVTPTTLKAAYARNGEIHINELGTPEEAPLTTGHQDMKPSWSKTGGMLVFFRLTQPAPRVSDWKTAICVVKTDGTGFQQLTDGTHTDFNPTWTRDGTNLVVFNRRNPKTGGYAVMFTKPGMKPGEEYAVSDPKIGSYAYTCLKDGRLFVSCSRHPQGRGYFLMTPSAKGEVKYERVEFAFPLEGTIDRVSLAPSETKLCCEFQRGFGPYRYPARTLYVADFDAATRTVSNPKAITDTDPDPRVTWLYPRWTGDESAVVYHCNKSGKSQLYLYRLANGSTSRVSVDPEANYLFPCGEAAPK